MEFQLSICSNEERAKVPGSRSGVVEHAQRSKQRLAGFQNSARSNIFLSVFADSAGNIQIERTDLKEIGQFGNGGRTAHRDSILLRFDCISASLIIGSANALPDWILMDIGESK
ncbi:MAG: hypothetical protein WB580_08540 [Candidatus Binataceae bacterium]